MTRFDLPSGSEAPQLLQPCPPVPVLRVTAIIDAPTCTVAGLLREAALLTESMRRCGHSADVPQPFLTIGDHVRLRVRLLPGLRLPLVTTVTHADAAGWASRLVSGGLPELELSTILSETPAGALVLDEIRWRAPWGALGRVLDVAVARRLVLRLLAVHRLLLISRAAELAGADIVVGAAVVRDGRLLVARRSRPADLAGRWELPGGQVEPGEPEADALARECLEELAVTIIVGDQVGPDLPLGRRRLLRIYAATLPAGEPRAIEHAELRWVRATELRTLDWLPADRAVLPELSELLRSR